jgi:hypothetical protein
MFTAARGVHAFILLLALTAHGQTLVHRYSFTSDASDSAGTADGTVVGGATFNGNGGLVLNGTNGYVALPAGIVSNLTAVTIETWATFGTIANNSFLFGFGNTDAGGAGENYIFCTPHGNGARAAITAADPGWQGEQQAAISSPLDDQSNVLVTTVFNPPAHFIGLYLNGVLVASNTAVTTTLAAVNNRFSYLGRSLYSADPYLAGTLNEFRIYNGALTNSQIALDAAAGPDRLVSDPGAFLTFSVNVTNMTVNSTQLPVAIGGFANVTNVNLFAYGQPVVTSANTNLAVVSASGVITAVGLGSVGISVSYGGQISSQVITITFPTNRFIFDSFGDGFWTLTNALNGKAFTVNATGASQAAYTNGAPGQQFELLYNCQNSTFRMRQHSTWLCVGAKNGGTAIGTGATTVNYSGAASQQWFLVDAGNGLYRLVNKASNYALQTDNGNPANVTLAAVSNNAAQLWGVAYQAHYPKKGCAGYEGSYAKLGLSWAYNYDDHTGTSLPASVVYEPMVWGQYWEPVSDLQSRAPGWVVSPQPVCLMTFNEPDNSGQANMSTATAISLWPSLQALNLPLVSPAMQNTYDAWAYDFFALIATNNYRVDYTAAHMYQSPNASALIGNLQSVYNTWGRPVWLTEFSPVDWNGNQGWTEDDDYNFLAEFMWMAEDNDWLKRYAIFPFSGTNPNPPYTRVTAGYRGNFFLADGVTLAPYGELYATWDANRTLQTRTPFFIHNLGTSFRLISTNAAAAPRPATIYTRDASAQWALLSSPTANQYYIISLKDGRRLRNNGGTPDLAPYGTTGPAVQWWMNGPDSKGYYYIDNLSASQSIRATGTAPAISFSMISDPAPSSATQWRLVKPYTPVTIAAATAPSLAISYTSQSATLNWSGNGLFYNVYRSTTSGGGYTKIASLVTNATYLDNSVQNGTAYFYVVTALNILGEESTYSNEVVARPASVTVLPVSYAMLNNGLQFSWPSDHTGWRLLMNTNSLGNSGAWVAVPNSAATNQMWLPFDPTQGNVFFRLVYP